MNRHGAWLDIWGLSRPALAVLSLILVLMALSGVTLWRTTTEVNRIDSERTAIALRNAMSSESAELLAIAADNAQWDDAAAAFYDQVDLDQFMAENYADTSAAGRLYDGVVALRSDGLVIANLRRGEMVTLPPQQWVGRSVESMMETARRTGAGYGLVAGADGVRLVAMARVTPTSADRLAAFEAAEHQPVYLLFTRPLDHATVAAIGRDLVLGNLAIVGAAGAQGQDQWSGEHHDYVSLRDVDGRIVAALRWVPSLPGNKAVTRSASFILMALLTGLLASILLLRRGMASVSEMSRNALLDTLSDLPNRRALRRLTKRVLRSNNEVALALIDLDGFKAINDLHGHAVGDELIVACARLIADLPVAPGSAARLGGDEFALLAYGPGASERLVAAADMLLARLQEPLNVGERAISVGASIGLAHGTGADGDASELMRRADTAMYVAKRAGKQRWVWFEPDHDAERHAVSDIEARLRRGLDEDGFYLVYQPVIDARRGSVSGFEALLRWDGGGGDVIGPDRFISIAEDIGLIDRLGEFALRRACLDALGWGDCTISVNVSSAQLGNPNFPELVAKVLNGTGFPARQLIIEITERYVVSDPVAAKRVIEAIRALGVRLALDDFGTGHASLGFLRRFSFDFLKIDRALVADAMASHVAKAILGSSISVARTLGIATVAEGIENESQALAMRAAGCDMLQGWHFAREGEAEAAAALLAEPDRVAATRG